jgi:chaperone modulatory protein CbpM
MISETEIVARFTQLEVHVLERWIAAGWVKPQERETGFLFDEADVARTHLLCDLTYDMELGEEELAIVLSLIDQLNGTRTMLQALTTAVQSQPAPVRDTILAEMRALLGAEPPAL